LPNAFLEVRKPTRVELHDRIHEPQLQLMQHFYHEKRLHLG
jgi:hypothetical protein